LLSRAPAWLPFLAGAVLACSAHDASARNGPSDPASRAGLGPKGPELPREDLAPRSESAPAQRLQLLQQPRRELAVPARDRLRLLPAPQPPSPPSAVLISGEAGRDLLAPGDRVFVRTSGNPDTDLWHARRKLKPIEGPDGGRVLGYLAIRDGIVRTRDPSQSPRPATVIQAFGALKAGTRLAPAPDPSPRAALHPRAGPSVQGQLLDSYPQRELVGQGQAVVIDRGAWQGLEPGHILLVTGRTVSPPHGRARGSSPGAKEKGVIMVLQTVPEASLALVVESHAPLAAGDRVVGPR
jgi:hypothetical protein